MEQAYSNNSSPAKNFSSGVILRASGKAEEAERELPDPVSTDELIKFTDRFNISRDEVMSQMGGSP